ncbi:MAG: N-acetyltransferase, partial [Alphaproteobacteria bacterium]|nr:N-acetyltransferase [Alphaproteobacteria bacterium]
MIEIVHETPEHASALESLLDRAFGPDRWSRVSYRLRENNKAVRELCFIALEGAQPVAVVRFFPLRVGEAAALLLGPVAVAPERQGHGIGS